MYMSSGHFYGREMVVSDHTQHSPDTAPMQNRIPSHHNMEMLWWSMQNQAIHTANRDMTDWRSLCHRSNPKSVS